MTEVKRVMMLSVDKREKSILFKPQDDEFSSYPQTYANLHEQSTIICQTGSLLSQYDIH